MTDATKLRRKYSDQEKVIEALEKRVNQVENELEELTESAADSTRYSSAEQQSFEQRKAMLSNSLTEAWKALSGAEAELRSMNWMLELAKKLDMAPTDPEKLASIIREQLKHENRLEGYIVIDLPDPEKSNFHDLLKGFEDYAKLRGYELLVSVEASLPNKFAFKFNFGNRVRAITPRQVQKDLTDYINKVENGDRLDDLPLVLPEPQHQTLLVSMRNRINFLNYNINFQRNELEWCKNILKNMSEGKISILSTQLALPPTTVHVLQENNPVIKQKQTVVVKSGTKKEQLEAIKSLRKLLKDNPKTEPFLTPLNEAQDELKKPKPDPQRMARILEPIKYGLKAMGLIKEIKDAAGPTWDAIKMLFGGDLS